ECGPVNCWVSWATRGTRPNPICTFTPSRERTPESSLECLVSPSASEADSWYATTVSGCLPDTVVNLIVRTATGVVTALARADTSHCPWPASGRPFRNCGAWRKQSTGGGVWTGCLKWIVERGSGLTAGGCSDDQATAPSSPRGDRRRLCRCLGLR